MSYRPENRVQIQILLHFLKLSLPGSPPPPPPPSSSSSPGFSRKRKRSQEPPMPPTTIEDELEAFMDKLSMWQLIGNLDIPGTKPSPVDITSKEKRDWIQIFAEDVVEHQLGQFFLIQGQDIIYFFFLNRV